MNQPSFNWKNPDWLPIYRARLERLRRIRTHPETLPGLREYYAQHPAAFISDWCDTFDPRLAGSGRSAVTPFILMPRQVEMAEFILERWRRGEAGLIEKSRDVGASFVVMSLAVALCLFNRNITIGVGSEKEDKLDRHNDPSTLFAKARFVLEHLPAEFRQGWDSGKNSAHLRLSFPFTQSTIIGEAGDNVGRGGRSSLFFLDEAAHIDHPKAIDAALVANTDCRIDLSSVSGMANSFAERRHGGRIPVFSYHWRDDLRKDEAWAEKKKREVDPIIWNAEYDLNYLGSVSSVVILPEWVQASIDAHLRLGIAPSGRKRGALDVADEGRDLNAFATCHGNVVTHCESWSGKGGDLFETAERAYLLCDEKNLESFFYDGDGLGAAIRAAVNQIEERRRARNQRRITVEAFRGSGEVIDPDRIAPGTEITNKDRYLNRKAQAWFALRERFSNTYRAIHGAKDVDLENIISLSSSIPELSKLCVELSMPQWKPSGSGKLLVQKAPDGAASPNHADSLMMLFSRIGMTTMEIWARCAGMEYSGGEFKYA